MSDLTAWVHLYADDLYRRAFFVVGHRETAEDIVQDTFLAAAVQADRFKAESAPKTWLFGILNHKIADHFRKQYRQPPEDLYPQFESDGHWTKSHAPLVDWPEETDDQFEAILEYCLERLPPVWRAAFLYKFLDQKKGAAICQELNIQPTNFWQMIHRAKLQLRQCLDANWFNPSI